MQFTGQSRGAHISSLVCSSWSGQGVPSPSACLRIVRDLCCVPPEQVLEHSDQSVQDEAWQLMHVLLQLISSAVSPQAAPPAKGWVRMTRFLCCLPLQYGVHGVHPPHTVITQSTGHAIVSAQTPTSVTLPLHCLPPPSAGTATSRFRVWVPPWHDALQLLHGAQSPHSQSTHSLEHCRICLVTPPSKSGSSAATALQDLPPKEASCVTFRYRI
mmetsp:Transcript_24539/g.58181  ORF Transcript_24539/g.58181 Transcript_24539/m.58181 type:complete len:214 (-) Transcript_24539:1311-1952(-)